VLNLIDQVTQGKPGAPEGNQNARGEKTPLDNIQGCPAPTGTSRDAALRRLRKDRPDLHAKVISGEKTAHRAMVEAGFRQEPTPMELAQQK